MAVHQQAFHVATQGNTHILDITERVQAVVTQSQLKTGIVNVSGKGSTLGITTIEFESGAIADFSRVLDEIAPANNNYLHNERWGDRNGYAHLRSALIGTSKSFAVRGGDIVLGTWQQIILCDFDDRPREREITVTVYGE